MLGPGSNAHGPNEFLHIPDGAAAVAVCRGCPGDARQASERGFGPGDVIVIVIVAVIVIPTVIVAVTVNVNSTVIVIGPVIDKLAIPVVAVHRPVSF